MSPLLAQLPTLIGVIVGAIASFGFSSLMERAKWKRSQSTRWDERRLTAYSEYASAVKTVVNLAYRIGAARGLPSTATPIEITDGLERLAAAEADRGAKWEAMQLLGDPATVAAARAWHECAWEIEWYAREKFEGAEGFTSAYKRAGEARGNYYRAARASLLVSTGDLPVPADQPEFIRLENARRELSDG